MIYWKVIFDDGAREGEVGYLILSDELTGAVLKDADGNNVTEGVSYHPIETPAEELPAWA